MLSVTTSRAVRSAMKASSDSGSTARTRAVASRTAAIFMATSALSTTTGRDAQDSLGTSLLDGLPVEVIEQGARLAGDHGAAVALDEEEPVAEDAIREGCGRLIEEDQIDAAPDGGLKPSGEAPEGAHIAWGTRAELDGNVSIAPRVRCTPCASAAEQRE